MDVSIISWIHNCEDTLDELYARLTKTMELIGASYEIILVDDGSSDASWNIIKKLHHEDPHVKAVNFSRHYGHSAGLQAGFDLARGDLVFTISPTLENAPESLPIFIEEMRRENYDMIIGCRKKSLRGRHLQRLASHLGNNLVGALIGRKVTDITSPYRLIRGDVLKNVKVYGNHHLFLPALTTIYGAKFKEIDIKHEPPKKKNYKAPKLNYFSGFLDILVLKFLVSFATPPFTTSPIKIFGGTGLVSLIIGVFIGLYLTYDRLILMHSIANRPLLLLAILMVMLGVLFLVMGLLGELLVRIYFEGQNKRTYYAREVLT